MKRVRKNRKKDWFNIAFLSFFTIAAIAGTAIHITVEGMNMALIPFAVFFWVLTGMSITAGYHRLFSHKAFKTNKFIKLFFLIFGAAAFENSIYKWGTDHRRHHAYCDEDIDPYDFTKGFWYAHMGWILEHDPHHKISLRMGSDFKNDPMIMWQDRNYILIATISSLLIPFLIGLALGSPIGGIAIIGFLRIIVTHHFTFFINSLCHMIGKQTYTDSNSAKDSWIMALLTFGEGYHNFHHYFQADYRNAVKWYQFDPTKWLILILSKLGLAWDLKATPESDIISARISMQKFLVKKKVLDINLISSMEVLYKHIEKLLLEYKKIDLELIKNKKLKNFDESCIKELKEKWNQAKSDLNNSLKTWQLQYVPLLSRPS